MDVSVYLCVRLYVLPRDDNCVAFLCLMFDIIIVVVAAASVLSMCVSQPNASYSYQEKKTVHINIEYMSREFSAYVSVFVCRIHNAIQNEAEQNIHNSISN